MSGRSWEVRLGVPLLLLFAAFAVNRAAFTRARANPLAPRPPADSVTPTPGFLQPDPSAWLRRHDEMVARAKKAPPPDVAFLGDSLTDGWADAPAAWAKLMRGRTAERYGIPGDTTNNLLWRFDRGLLDGPAPRAAVLLIGTNNRRTSDPTDIAAGVLAAAKAIRAKWPTTAVLLLAIPPEGRWLADPRRGQHAATNARVQALAVAHGFAFHDFGPCLLSPDGELLPTVSRDETHFTPAGYARIADDLAPVLDRILAR